ncbi:MAG TPA: hypothetical protein VHN37_04050 [Actinomycetota bacterium]|nr:hypothetical protein [Actinomycetota bacterium]
MNRRTVSSLMAALLAAALLPVPPAHAKTERLDFVRKERQRNGPDKSIWGAMARDRDDLRRLWDRYRQTGPLPVIRFRKNVAILAGTRGSSTCPYRLHDLRLDRDRKRIVARMYVKDHDEPVACTDDLAPRTFTVAVARADLKPFRPRELKVRPRRIDDPT